MTEHLINRIILQKKTKRTVIGCSNTHQLSAVHYAYKFICVFYV